MWSIMTILSDGRVGSIFPSVPHEQAERMMRSIRTCALEKIPLIYGDEQIRLRDGTVVRLPSADGELTVTHYSFRKIL